MKIKRSKNGTRNLIQTICKFCNNKILDYKCNNRKFCNQSCNTSFRNKYNNPSKKHHWKNNPIISAKMKIVLDRNRKNRILPTGENHHMWEGDDVGYQAIHGWAKRNIKIPKKCPICNKDSKRIELANLNHEYKRDIKHWSPMCSTCHRNYDIKINKWRQRR